MLLLRIVGLLTIFALGAGLVAYLFSGDRRYLGFCWRITRYALIFALVVMALMFFERLL